MTNQRTSRSRSSTSLISSSTSPSTLCGTADGVVKSKRSRPGALSEPACAAESPSARRSPACSRCVAEWLRDTDSAPLHVDLREHQVAGTHLAGQHRRAVGDQPGQRRLHVDHGQLRLAAGGVDRDAGPSPACWPPPSA